MVRHKTRWLLVKIDFAADDDDKNGNELAAAAAAAASVAAANNNDKKFPTRKDCQFIIRQQISSCFGLTAEHAAIDTQVRFVDPDTRLILLRVPRKDYGMVRAAICLMTNLDVIDGGQQQQYRDKKTTLRGRGRPNVVASVISVNGSARTAKLATMAYVRKFHRHKLSKVRKGTKELRNGCNQLETVLTTIQNID